MLGENMSTVSYQDNENTGIRNKTKAEHIGEGKSWMPQIKSLSGMCDYGRSLLQWHCRSPLI